MRSLSFQIALCAALLACAAERPPSRSRAAPNRAEPATADYAPPDASGFGRVGELTYLEEIVGDAAPTDTLPMLVLIHGRGDKPARGWLPLDLSQPVRVIMPRAPLPFGGGYSWFSIRALEANGPNGDELARQLSDGADALRAALDVLRAQRPTRGLPIAAGFSQGGMLSYTLAVRHPDAFRVLLPIAGLLPDALWPKTAPSNAPPVRALHGTADALVPVDAARAAVQRLARIGYQIELREFEGVQHSITPEMLEVLDGWLERALREP
jgi:phospholipase/carboxylesterase